MQVKILENDTKHTFIINFLIVVSKHQYIKSIRIIIRQFNSNMQRKNRHIQIQVNKI